MITGDLPNPFIQNEIGFIERAFDRVIIFAFSSFKNQPLLKCSDKVEIHDLHMPHKPRIILKRIIRGLDVDYGQVHRNHPKQYLFELFSRGGASLALEKMEKILADKKIPSGKVVIYSFWMNVPALTGIMLKDYFQKKLHKSCVCVSRAHSYEVYDFRNKYGYNPFQPEIVNSLDHIYPCSVSASTYLKQKYPSKMTNIETEYLGSFDHGLNPHDPKQLVFVTCSGLIPLKRVNLFAKAFALLIHQGFDVHWHCFGSGKEYHRIVRTIEKNGCMDKVTFHGGVDNTEVFKFYQEHSVTFFVNTSSTEGIPVSIMEAMSMGIPCIATDVGATSELVSDDNGYLLDKNDDPEAISQKIKSAIFAGEKTYSTKRIAARKKWHDTFNAEKNYEKFAAKLANL